MPLTSPFSPTSPYQNLQPLGMTHLNHNPFKPSGIFPGITYSIPPHLEPQANPRTESSPMKKDKDLFCMQKTRSFWEKLSKKGKSSKAS